jgi:O-antigen/teichoic acid export membrane protein
MENAKGDNRNSTDKTKNVKAGEWNKHRVTRQFAASAVSLGLRQVFAQGSNILGTIMLARILSPAEFGIYAVTNFWLSFLMIFGGTGFAANLIRQPAEPELADYRAVFSVQLLVVLALAASLWAASPILASIYQLSSGGLWLFRLIAISLFATSFLVIPQIQLERRLDFSKLARAEVAQAITFNVVVVYLAWRGWGVLSFGVAILLRSAVGAVIINLMNPWSPRWHWDLRRVRPHVSFAVLFQGSQLVSLIKDSITPIFIGLLVGVSAVGYVNWAGIVAAYSLFALMILQRLYLPAFSRLHDQPESLSTFVEQVLLLTNAISAPLAILTLVLIVPITREIFGNKWLPALPIFYLLWTANIFVPSATPLLSLLNATGRARTAFRFTVLWMAGTWVFGVPLIMMTGAIGFALANCLVQITNILLFRAAQRLVPFRILPVVLPTWVVALVMGFGIFSLNKLWPASNLAMLLLYIFLGLAVYYAVTYSIYQKRVRRVLLMLRKK